MPILPIAFILITGCVQSKQNRSQQTADSEQERIDSVLSCYWDSTGHGDISTTAGRDEFEKSFSTFISLFAHGSEKTYREAVRRMMAESEGDTSRCRMLFDLTEHYLVNPNSPVRNEGYFIIFAEEMLKTQSVDQAYRFKFDELLRLAKMNRPGTRAADFRYITREGKKGTLHSTEAKRLLLIFYDPDCENCSRIIGELRQDGDLRNAVATGEMTVLAVYTEGNRKLWDKTKSDMPAEWIVAIDDSGITENEIYHLPAMPVLYLLDADKKVLRKDFLPGGNQGT